MCAVLSSRWWLMFYLLLYIWICMWNNILNIVLSLYPAWQSYPSFFPFLFLFCCCWKKHQTLDPRLLFSSLYCKWYLFGKNQRLNWMLLFSIKFRQQCSTSNLPSQTLKLFVFLESFSPRWWTSIKIYHSIQWQKNYSFNII